jgi:Zn-dependent M32 family carboxypeptidase
MDDVRTVTRDMLKLLNDMTKKIVELSDRVALLEYDKAKKAESDRTRAESYGEISQEISNLLSTVNAIGENPVEVSRAGNGSGAQQTPTREAPSRITAET